MNMEYIEFITRVFQNTLPHVERVPCRLVREYGCTFDTLELTLYWLYMNRHFLAHKEPLELLFQSPFFFHCYKHDHWIDKKLEKTWEEMEIIQLDTFLEQEADKNNYITFS